MQSICSEDDEESKDKVGPMAVKDDDCATDKGKRKIDEVVDDVSEILFKEEDEAADADEIQSEEEDEMLYKKEDEAIDADLETSDNEWNISRSRVHGWKKQKAAEAKKNSNQPSKSFNKDSDDVRHDSEYEDSNYLNTTTESGDEDEQREK